MKKLLTAALLAFLSLGMAHADVVLNDENFPDPNFRAFITQRTGVAEGGTLTNAIIANQTDWYSNGQNLVNKSLTNLKGIEQFTSLRYLNCSKNQLTSLDLSNNKALKYLSCYNNKLETLNINGCSAITYLYCYANQLTSLDVSTNTALLQLYCYTNKLTSINISNNLNLTIFQCGNNQIKSLDVTKNTALTNLNCRDNKISSLDVSNNTALTTLVFYGNLLTSIDVSKNTKLTTLSCYSNQLTSLDVTKNTALTTLYCRDNKLTSIDVTKNTALTSFYCNENQLSTLDVSKNTALTILQCTANHLTSLDVSKNTALTELNCRGNKITSLDTRNNAALSTLACYDNQLASIDVSKNTNLKILTCDNNLLTSLDISNNTKLDTLTCYYNQLTSLDVSKNTSLVLLYCQFNHLTSLDVSKNKEIKYLTFDSNDISSIDLSNNTKLEILKTNHNKLPKLDLRNNPLITSLTAAHNMLTDVDVTGLTQLTHFCVSFNKGLKEIKGLETCTSLNELFVNDDNFYALDVSNNTKLKTLHTQNNHLIQVDATPLTIDCIIPYDITYYHNDTYDGYGWGGTNQTRTMPATRENVDADGSGVKEWFVVKMPVDAAVPDGLGKKETFVNDASKKLNVVEIETQGVYSKVIDGVTYFYLPIDNAPEKFSFTYNINHLANKNYGMFADPNANGSRRYIGYDGETMDALLQVIITPRYPSATFWMDGEYRSTFIPEQKLNTYKNTIALDGVFDQGDKTYDGNTYTITRKAANSDDETTVATVALQLVEPAEGDAYYTYTVAYPNGSWAANTNQENRWDNVPTVNNGVVTDGIKVCDYFAASTTDGGDKAGTYTYSVKEDHFANNFVVPVYAATTTVTLVTDHSAWKADQNVVGYTFDEINSEDEDHHVLNLPKGVAAEHSEFYNTTFKYHSLYRYGNIVEKFIIGRNETLSLPYYLEFGEQGEASNELRYVYGMHVISPYGENSYGTNEVVVPKAIITIESTDLAKSEYTFHEGSRYYSCLLNLGFMQSVDAFTTQSGGYRVWRNCDSEDEEHTELLGRANDYMFYKNMDLTSHAAEVKEVGSQQLSVTNASGTVFPYTSGTFGSSATTPKASFLARAYYKASPKSSAANMKKAPATTYYYVAEALVDVEWNNVVTGVSDVADKQVSSIRYYDLAGHSSTKPFCGVNIVVTKYTDGSSVSTKILR
ncbi:MAG: hypothetical protein Q4E41_03385 [Bacteroidales bacterium]|nr:hypothetical protein [Bacteroidales bacterium]